ncbi:MAG: SIR22 domain-containing protein [Nitrospira sp.]|nr:MAG: SIR22 domain-containing protein [Nitrospira sp.]
MTTASNFTAELEAKVAQQLKSQRVGYLLGAGSSYLNNNGYPLAFQLWDKIKGRISDEAKRKEIQDKLDSGANGIEHALDLLDDGGANDTSYRHLVTKAIAEIFISMAPPLDLHAEFVKRIAQRGEPLTKVFSLNYDPLIERAASVVRVRLIDGYTGAEHSYFDPAVFEERIGRIRGTHRSKQFEETVKPIHLLKLHGSLGWYECPTNGIRRCGFSAAPPASAKRLMIPPQRRKAADTMNPPYSALWSAFRGCLGQNATPMNRLVCIGYGFADEHVNTIIDSALARTDFTVLMFTKALADPIWTRWSAKTNAIVVTENRCALKGQIGAGHADLWSFERLAKEV